MDRVFKKIPNISIIFLCIVIFLAAFLRFYQLDINPPAINWDEAALGYNAFSLGIDGRDEFGRFLPFDYLESFGDFKPPMYAYLTIIPVKIFGLNEYSTRFASAFFGTFTVLITFFLVKSLFPSRRDLAYITTAILAISPWHIMLSRAAFEANVATFFIIVGVWLFLKAVQEKPAFLLLSIMSFVASAYTFNSARIVAPLLLVCLSIGFRKKLISQKKYLFSSIVLGAILVLPIAFFLISPQASLRFKEVNIFSDIEILKLSNQEMSNSGNKMWAKVIHNRRIVYAREYTKHYFDNLNPSFLFDKGDGNPRFSTQDVGQMYKWDIPFFVVGILFLIRRKEKNWWIVPIWMAIGIIPAAFARETPHALRIEGSLPTFQIITAYGVSEFLIWIESAKGLFKKIKKPVLVLIAAVLIINSLYFLHGLFVHYPREQSAEWLYGYEESINYINSVENNYDKIYFDDFLGRPYIYMLFYKKYNPQKFRELANVTRDSFGFVHVKKIGKYNFQDALPTETISDQKVLYINEIKSIPDSARIKKIFYLKNKQPVMAAYTL
ncbi:MAG TPA: glycosyltransferase family 39 protein [Candidatus Limnocylindrales bacterium]|nr:glycosyltransferase family 39 protein [Candidatus Limnocylindrales bacterium]